MAQTDCSLRTPVSTLQQNTGQRTKVYAALIISLAPLISCGDASLTGVTTGPANSVPVEAIFPSPGGVDDLSVSQVTESSMELTWTQVDDGIGNPAHYLVKYARPSIDWSEATTGCTPASVSGDVGAPVSCTVEELDPGTDYEFLLMSYRLEEARRVDAKYSNITPGRTAGETRISAGPVSDLAVQHTTSSSVTLGWTEVDDGMGRPATYRVKYASPTMDDWTTASIGCDRTIHGHKVHAPISCTVTGLDAGTAYEFQLLSFRMAENGTWAGSEYSNIASASTAPFDAPDGPSGGGAMAAGIWIDRQDIMRLPTSGAAWEQLLSDAKKHPGSARISNQDSDHDVYTMAAALVCVRTGDYCAKARQGVLDAIGTERGGRWLAVGRNLAAYMIAADLLDLRADGDANSAGTRFEEWAEGWLTRRLSDNNSSNLRPFEPFKSSANAAAQEGLAYVAVAAYLRDDWALQRAWDAFRTFACDPSAPDRENIYLDPPVRDGWTHDDRYPCAVNPAGATRPVPSGRAGAGSVHRIDGAIVGDMRRGGAYRWTPGYTQYVWVGLEGFVPAAAILQKAGYPAFEVADRAVLRTHEYLLHLRVETGDRRWFDGDRAREIVHLVNNAYGTSLPLNGVGGAGRTIGYTSWTHR